MTEKRNTLITLRNVSAAYEEKQVLSDVTLTVYEDDFLGVIGPNGGGKTTLIKLILGLIKPTSGEITFYRNGQPTQHINMGYLPQYNAIDKKFPISVYDTVLSGLSKEKGVFHSFKQVHHDLVKQTIERVGLNGLEKRAIGELSGGQIQRALLGRAIVSQPDILILDEPNTYLDRGFEMQLYRLLGDINKECAIILVSHDIGTVLQNVRAIACVNETLDYHPDTEVSEKWLEEHFGCPIELLGHGHLPHRILKCHTHQKI